MTAIDEPRFCIHCGNHIARDDNGNWTYAAWAHDDRIPIGNGIRCPAWESGRLREEVDLAHAGRHYPGILVPDNEDRMVDD